MGAAEKFPGVDCTDDELEELAKSEVVSTAQLAAQELRARRLQRKAEQLAPIVAKTKRRLEQKATHGGVEIHLSTSEAEVLVLFAEIGLRSLGAKP